ncbi:DUF11 domain-containing protein [Streptomyces cocklensis]|uniref:Conserved repeat domain-containing protein n=1 Tax=Actinacidiphila cocklensis TaxID=887465 RepID=A0A9W4E336_9ACTN|nr:DUF11 domain-containing protein [Actinacidiphila cocklensis]MDD1057826.1 DUF11 domain-containing protein [Actinacidiphila cocklensis]CAG6398557.1 Conserved repeat domain-containing protein [Actinacidiphila cocklensis]
MLRLLPCLSAHPPARRARRSAARAAVAISAALLATAAGSLSPAMAHGGGGGGGTPPPPAGVGLQKTVQNVTSPGTTQAQHSDTLNWVVSYDTSATGGPAPATITDPVSGAPGAQAYVPGSLRVPPGWTPGWSTDGSTFTGTDQGAATTAVQAVNDAAIGTGTNVSGDLLPPVQAATRSTGGDGFTPILYRAASGDVEAWNIYHHSGPAAPLVVCNDLSSGQPCAGGPWPRPLNTTAGPLGSGGTGNVYSTLTPQYVMDPGRPGVVYYPAVATGSVGAGCLDLAARANCGFFPLAAATGSPSSANGLAGLVAQGGRLYGVANTGQVLCLDIVSQTPCAGQPFAAIVPPNHDLPGNTYSLYQGALAVADGRIYASSSPMASGSTAPGAPALGCFDPATGQTCTGWTTPHPAGPNANAYTYNAFVAYDTAGHPSGVCTADSTGGSPSTSCYALDGGPLATPATGLDALPAGVLVFNPEVVNAGGDNRSYFAVWGGSLPGDTVCYSWTHAQPCAGFPAVAGHPAVNSGVTRDYGYSYDATTRCLIGLGDAGILFSMDPGTGGSPCLHTGASVTLKPSDFYCDGGTGHAAAYTEARLTGLDLAHTDPAATTVAVTDPDGTVVATPALSSSGTVDLSGISATAHPSITVTVQFSLTDTSDFADGRHPSLTAYFQGDDPQLCLRTVVTSDCATSQVADTATGSDATGALTSNTVTVPVQPGAACQPHVTVDKEICAGTSSHTCGPGGSGPWVKSSPVGLLQVLGTAYWRITVTNAGPVDATGVTVNDPTTPSCSQGSFTLAAGTSRQVYCNSFLLALPVKNTATASFTPANSPHGTHPTTTDPSSAVACSLLCILLPAEKH